MDVVIHQLVIVALVTAVGIVAAKVKIITPKIRAGLSRLVLELSVPCVIISSGYLTIEGDDWIRVGAVAIISFIYHLFLFFMMKFFGRHLIKGEDEGKISVLIVTFGNIMFVGFPIVLGIYGNDGIFLGAIFAVGYNALMYSIGINYVSKKKAERRSLKTILLKPFYIAIVIMFVLLLTQYKVPAPVQETLTMIGNLCTPLSLLVIGAMVQESDILSLIKDYRLFIVTALRLLVAPLLMILAMYFVPLDVGLKRTVVALAAMPGGAMPAMVAEQEQCAPRFATLSVVQSTVLFLLIFPFVIYLSHKILV